MPLGTPGWWYGSGVSLMPVLLEPAALIWRGATWLRRKFARSYRSGLPVICVGNPTAGGAGKTPTAIALAELLREMGERPAILTRGHGGRIAGPHLVDPSADTAEETGDEPLLLARAAPAVICADRAKGARFIEGLDASVIVMDDGFHNPGLAKDVSILVIDRARGVGNGQVIPAGPLREALPAQLDRAQAMLLVGQGGAGEEAATAARRRGIPVWEASLEPAGDTGWIERRAIVAFAGIGDPDRFFRDLESAGARLERSFAFPDHHPFTQKDSTALLAAADAAGAELVTTEKDLARLQGRSDAAFEALRNRARAWPVKLEFRDRKSVEAVVRKALSGRRKDQSA